MDFKESKNSMDKGTDPLQAPHAACRLGQCRVCRAPTDNLFTALVLARHPVAYGHCPECGLIQTEYPYWLPKAYSRIITVQDVGLVRRNLRISKVIQAMILDHFNPSARFLDYAGGCGLLVRLLRDEGFDFHRHDPLCENVFAGEFDLPKLQDSDRFELITACEVFEHLVEPEAELRKLFHHADAVFLTTELCPAALPRSVDDWWYFYPENGQHVTFYSLQALGVLADKAGAALYSDGLSRHLLTRRRLAASPFQKPTSMLRWLDRMLGRLRNALRRRMHAQPPQPSLLPRDAEKARSRTAALSSFAGPASKP